MEDISGATADYWQLYSWYLKNSNTTNSNVWRWITSWVSNSNIEISIDFVLIKINIFTLSKKQQKCNVNEENKNFSADGSEYNAVVDFLLFVQIYRLKYKFYQMKDNLLWYFVFINNKKMRTVSENTKPKTAQNSFFYVNGLSLASLKGNWFLKIRICWSSILNV